METAKNDTRIILTNRHDALMEKIDSFKTGNMTARDRQRYNKIVNYTNLTFIQLCWHKMGISEKQIMTLTQEDLDELAEMLYRKSIGWGLLQTLFLVCIPIVGWASLAVSLDELGDRNAILWENMRYFWWFRRIRKFSGKNFSPSLLQQ